MKVNFLYYSDNNYDEEDDEIIDIKKSMIDGSEDSEDLDNYNINNNNYMIDILDKKNPVSNLKIIPKLQKNNSNPNLMEAIKNEIEKIDKENHKFEDIVAFLIKFIESNQTDLKILIINCINNIIQNSSKLFLTEMLLPFYKTSMQPNNLNELVNLS